MAQRAATRAARAAKPAFATGADALTDEQLRRIEAGALVFPDVPQAMAAELLAARARITELGQRCDTIAAERFSTMPRFGETLARITELEAELHDEGNRVGRLEDALRTACADGSAARDRVAELEAENRAIRAAVDDSFEATRKFWEARVAELEALCRSYGLLEVTE
jgi:chromosome segregation ATPase